MKPAPLDIIRVFISSTFRDMHAERDHLHRQVFPELRARCDRRGAEFAATDLRWGVTGEEAQRIGALEMCLAEIERCRPFVLGLLGDRYGWVPPAREVAQEFFEAARRAAADCSEVMSLLDKWYRLDTTTAPPVYRLPGGPLSAAVEAELVRFWEAAGLPQEGESITAREIARASLEPGWPPTHGLYYFRRLDLASWPLPLHGFQAAFSETDPRRRERLEELKATLRQRPGVLVREYTATVAGLRIDPALLPTGIELPAGMRQAGLIRPEEFEALATPLRLLVEKHGTVALTGLEDFGRQVCADLWAVIEPVLGEQGGGFVQSRTRRFYGRHDLLNRLLDHATQGPGRAEPPLVVTGAAGSGKSTLLAELVRGLSTTAGAPPVVAHFVGATPGSAEVEGTLRAVCEGLRRVGRLTVSVPADPEQLRARFPDFVEQAAAVGPLVLVLDALDQLTLRPRPRPLLAAPGPPAGPAAGR